MRGDAKRIGKVGHGRLGGGPRSVIAYRRTLRGLFWSVVARLRRGELQAKKDTTPPLLAREQSVRQLAAMFSCATEQISAYLDECRTDPLIRETRCRLDNLSSQGAVGGSASVFDAETLYLLLRRLRPARVVETGVLYGVFSAYILAALERNGTGHLYSIDLPFTFGVGSQGMVIPESLHRRWSLLVGDAVEKLPGILQRLGNIQLFHHDSNHNYDHMTWEFTTTWPHISPGGVLSSHDVVLNPSFSHFNRRHRAAIAGSFVVRNLGVTRKQERNCDENRH